jgi:hypothetical protein
MFINNPMDKEEIIRDFPNIKLSYETVIHKKVYQSDIIFAIPKGKKCFAWFTYYLNEPVCFILELFNKKQISTIQIVHVSFKTDLSLGTILYGTMFTHSNVNYFTIEDLFFYKGSPISTSKWLTKFEIINTILKKELKQVIYGSKFVIFGLPILSNDLNDMLIQIKATKYELQSLQFILFNNCNKYLHLSINELHKEALGPGPVPVLNAPVITIPTLTIPSSNNNLSSNNNKTRISNNKLVFNIKADLQNDIYHLYCYDKSEPLYYTTACVPTYEISVMMNTIFRTIKENERLDALEESDDEDEFQNECIDKFVDLSKNYKMLCGYNYKFKKWTPIKIVDNGTVCQKSDLYR